METRFDAISDQPLPVHPGAAGPSVCSQEEPVKADVEAKFGSAFCSSLGPAGSGCAV